MIKRQKPPQAPNFIIHYWVLFIDILILLKLFFSIENQLKKKASRHK